MDQGLDSGLAPPLGDSIEIRIEVAEDDVAMGVDQRDRHGS
jgi:hypothetical protein